MIPNNSFRRGPEHWGTGANCMTLNWHSANKLGHVGSNGAGVDRRVSQCFLSIWCVDAWSVRVFLQAKTPLNTFPPLLTQIKHLLYRAMRAIMTCRGKRPSLPSNLSGCQVFLSKLLEAFSSLSRNARCGKQAVERSTSPASEKLQGKLPTAPTTQTLQERQTYAYL